LCCGVFNVKAKSKMCWMRGWGGGEGNDYRQA